MSRAEELRRVVELLGIHTRHVDALGVVYEPDFDALSALVAAFGLSSEPDQAAAAIAEVSAAKPLGLDPLCIVAVEAPVLRVRLPPGSVIDWQCHLEDGDRMVGRGTAAPVDGRSGESELHLPHGLPLGYHRLDLEAGGAAVGIELAVTPSACHLPPNLQPGQRRWGLTTQLYGLRSARNWGIGDFSDLAELCRGAAQAGADTVGINPLHALFAAEPAHASPYSPSSRSQLDYLYIDVTAVPGFAEDPAISDLTPEAAIAAVRDAELVYHAQVAALKRPVLEALYSRFRDADLGSNGGAKTALGAAFRGFQKNGGERLTVFATFEALHEHRDRDHNHFSWRDWPAPWRDPKSAKVAAFAAAHRDRVGFFEFLQWQADRQLGAAAAAGREAGLSLGLYRDLAVGVNPNGAAAWADQALVVPGMAIGAPPDALSRGGQDWGLAPVNPLALRQRGFAPFIAALRANMRHAGVLRIDHVMSLQRLYWVPAGKPASAGAYVDYPFAELLRLLALESQRQRCAVIGEDLGTVPDGFRETLQAAKLLSYRITVFERRRDGNFTPPSEYEPMAAASAATHDLPTLKGFWLGRDIAWRQRLKLYPDAAAEAADLGNRYRDRWQLLEALEREGLMPRERFGEFLPLDAAPVYTTVLGEAILAFLARSRARLMLVQLEDVAGEAEQANLPGTDGTHPNWRRRLAVRLEDLLAGPKLQRIAGLVAAERRRSAGGA
jgi:4-alpha-glucanotransferase